MIDTQLPSSSSSIIKLIKTDFDNLSLTYISSSLPCIEGYLIKHPIHKSKSEFCYIFISIDYKYSIKCLIKSIQDEIVEGTLYQIQLDNYSFDLLLRIKEDNILEYNTILCIQSYTSIDSINELNKKVLLSPNINKDDQVKTLSSTLYNKIIRQVINQYNSAFPLNDFVANQFIQRNFTSSTPALQSNKVSLFEMIKKVYQIPNDSDGVLLRQRIGIDYSAKYFLDNDDETNEILTTMVNWKELLLTSSTIKEKQKELGGDPFTPTPVLFKEFNDKVIKQEKKHFLQRKAKRDNTTEEEKKAVPKTVNELMSFYGDINVNIGHSMVEKYLLYQRYTNLAKEAGIVQSK